MSDLHQAYARLRGKFGMPECERLRVSPARGWVICAHSNETEAKYFRAIHEADAKVLIDAHVRDWWLGQGDRWFTVGEMLVRAHDTKWERAHEGPTITHAVFAALESEHAE